MIQHGASPDRAGPRRAPSSTRSPTRASPRPRRPTGRGPAGAARGCADADRAHVGDRGDRDLAPRRRRGSRSLGDRFRNSIALTADDMDKPGVEGAMWCCSPPPRDSAAQEAVWTALKDGTFQTFSRTTRPTSSTRAARSPHSMTTFKEMANGVPGLEIRLPLLFSEATKAASACSSSWR